MLYIYLCIKHISVRQILFIYLFIYNCFEAGVSVTLVPDLELASVDEAVLRIRDPPASDS